MMYGTQKRMPSIRWVNVHFVSGLLSWATLIGAAMAAFLSLP